jgi:hypothetical protein
MTTIKVKTSSPGLRIQVKGLNSAVTLVVLGVKAPPAGSFEAVNELLGTLTTSQPELDLNLPVVGTEFRHAALKFAVTTFKNDLGTTTVEVIRSQDPAEAPTFNRPVNLGVTLKRASATSPTYLEQIVVLEEDV